MPDVDKLSAAQKAVVGLPPEALVVSACAGSGKTKTAVHRVATLRSLLTDPSGRILLLSFSNIAVETFQREYGLVVKQGSRGGPAVEIDTVDGFLTKNLLRPHGHLVMGCDRCPFLVDGSEPFLKNFTVWDGERPAKTSDIRIALDADKFTFRVGRWAGKAIDPDVALAGIAKLGKVGAYTHESARYWTHRLIMEMPFLLRAIARRYSNILVDEAQDIGTVHQALLEKIAGAGAKLSLIGDVNQGIFEFTGATGDFLKTYHERPGVHEKELETNFRSVPSIVKIANSLSGRNDNADRDSPGTLHGACYIEVDEAQRDDALSRFGSLLEKALIPSEKGVVIFRATQTFNVWSGPGDPQGQGVVKAFVASAVWRDKARRFDLAFEQTCIGIVGLLADNHDDVLSKIKDQSAAAGMRAIRREIWSFVRDPNTGLPSATLNASADWHPALVSRVKALLDRLQTLYGLNPGANLGNKLAKKAIPNGPLLQLPADEDIASPKFRMSTVHKVKGESLAGVMYVASKANIEELLAGTGTEAGKIGYVALTRARNLFVLGVPKAAIAGLQPKLNAAGFVSAEALVAAHGQL